jgi:polar amino acid transport system substrate-binding protein
MKIFIFTFFVLSFYNIFSKETVVFVTDEYAPYVSKTKQKSGIFPEVVKKIFKEKHIKVQIKFQPWRRCEANLSEGNAFAAFPYLKTKEREAKHNFSDPVIYFYPKFFYLKNRFKKPFEWNNLSDFKHYSIGGVLGYWYEERFKKAKLNVDYEGNDSKNIKKLVKKMIDFTIIDELVGWNLIERMKFDKSLFAVSKKPTDEDTFHLMVSRKYKNSEKYLKIFNQGFKKMKQSNEYHKIFKKYSIPDEYMTK